MLYLVKLDNTYKIGYSEDIISRIKQISATHIEVELISTKLGNMKDEKRLHELCKEYHIKNELFEINKEVCKIFNTYICENLRKTPEDNIEQLKEENKRLTEELEKYIYYTLSALEHSDELVKMNKELNDVIEELTCSITGILKLSNKTKHNA